MTLYPTFHGGLPYLKYADGSDGSDDDKNEDGDGTYDEWLKEQNTTDAVDPISNSVDRKIRSKLGPQAMGFFELYRQARLMHDGAPAPESGLVAAYRTEARVLTRLLASKLDDKIAAPAINTLYDAMQDVKPWLQKIDQGYGTPTYRILGGKLALILVDVLTAAGIPVTTKPGADKTKWPSIRLMNRKQQQFEELRENHPDIAASIETNRETLRTQDGEVTGKITAAGLIPATTKIQGRLVQIGTDPATNEQLVYTRDGQVLSVAQFKESLGDTRKRDKRSVNLFPNGLPSGVKASPSLAGIRTLTDEQLADPEFIPDQEREPLPDGEEPVPGKLRPFLRIEYRALTDDAAAEPGTRVYPTKKDKSGRAVIVEGRFKGVYLDDIVNKAGRLIEGAAYDFDKDGKMVKFATKSPTGSKDVTANKEPYVTVDSKGRLLLKIPYSREYTQARTKVRALSAPRVPSIEAEPETNNTTFTFEPKDFPSIRRSIGGCVLSKPAADMIAAYFEQIGRQETALKEPALKNYTFDKIGGFKQIPIIDDATGLPRVTPPLYKDLFDKQKEALSWLESKGYSGVAALGTGVGKTLLCIATIKKMDRDGFATDGQRFLYVCPNNLRGNFRKQAFEFLRDGNDVVGRTDVLTYGQFVVARKLNPAFGTKQGDPTKGFPQDVPASKALLTVIEGSDVAIPGYAALFFDEAHILTKNSKSKLSRAAQSLNHPRKVMLTASPMEDDPEELYVAAAISNNVDLNPKRKRGEISQVVKDKMSFFRRYVQTVGGRAVGLKPNVPGKDPNKQDDFYAWAKTNVFSVNKRDIHEMKLPECNPTTVTVTMSPRVEAEYRKATQEIATTLKAAIAVAKSGKKPSSTKDFTNLFGVKLAGILKRISELSDMPGLLFPGERSPKVDQSAEIIRQSIGNGKRTLLFTDNPKFAEYTAQDISKQVPSLLHAVALSGKIRVFQDGAEVASYTARKYKWEDEEGKPTVIPKTLWASHILGTVLGQDPKVSSMTLTKTYAHGQNLQAFSVVVHLDRDSFSSEMIKQRTARAWRTGQKSTVSSVTLDAAYDTPKGGNDVTLDAIRGYIQAMQDKLFTEIVGNAQLAKIGPEWAEMQGIDASLVAVNRRLFELVVSPSPENIAAMESKS